MHYGSTPMSAPTPVAAPPTRGRRFAVLLGWICLAALVWRVAYVFIAHPPSDTNLIDEGDGFYYAVQADQLGRGHGFYSPFDGSLAADHPPLTIVALAPVALVFGHAIVAKRLAMALIGTLVVALIGLLGRRLGRTVDTAEGRRRGDRVGLVAAGLAAVNPNFWMNDAVIMSEAIATALYVGGFLVAYRIIDTIRTAGPTSDPWPSTRRQFALLGAVVGLCTLARAEALLLLPLLVAPLGWWAWRRSGSGPILRPVASLALAGLLAIGVIAPWSAYISSKYGKVVTLSTNDGITLWGANCPDTYFGDNIGSWSFTCIVDVLDAPDGSAYARQIAGNEAEQASGFRELGTTYARSHKGRWPVVLAVRQARTWGVYNPSQQAYSGQGEGRPRWASWSGFAALWILAPLAVAGAVVSRGRPLWPLASAVVLVVVMSALFYGLARFRLPADVAVTVLAALAIAAGLDRLTGRSAGTAEP